DAIWAAGFMMPLLERRQDARGLRGAASHPLADTPHLFGDAIPGEAFGDEFAAALAHRVQLRIASAEESGQTVGDFGDASLDSDGSAGLKTFRQVALRSHEHRPAIGPGLQQSHGKTFAQGGENYGRGMVVSGGFVLSELWSEKVDAGADFGGELLQLRLVPALI